MKRIKCLKRVMAAILVMVMCCGAGVTSMAAEKENHLPEGWKSIGLDMLSEEQIEEINEVPYTPFDRHVERMV